MLGFGASKLRCFIISWDPTLDFLVALAGKKGRFLAKMCWAKFLGVHQSWAIFAIFRKKSVVHTVFRIRGGSHVDPTITWNNPKKLEKPCITKGEYLSIFGGPIFPCNKVIMVDPQIHSKSWIMWCQLHRFLLKRIFQVEMQFCFFKNSVFIDVNYIDCFIFVVEFPSNKYAHETSPTGGKVTENNNLFNSNTAKKVMQAPQGQQITNLLKCQVRIPVHQQEHVIGWCRLEGPYDIWDIQGVSLKIGILISDSSLNYLPNGNHFILSKQN